MIRVNNQVLEKKHFPDNTLLIRKLINDQNIEIEWLYENDIRLMDDYLYVLSSVSNKTHHKKAYAACKNDDAIDLSTFTSAYNIVSFLKTEKSKYSSNLLFNNSASEAIFTVIRQFSKEDPTTRGNLTLLFSTIIGIFFEILQLIFTDPLSITKITRLE